MSTWNVDNYFWEEHNSNVWATKRLNELAGLIQPEGWVFEEIKFTGVEANKAIRKNREIRSFEFSFECKFKYQEFEGKIKFPDVSNDAIESPEDWEYDLTFTGECSKKNPNEKKAIRTAADKTVIPLMRAAFDTFSKEFMSIPSDLNKQ